MVQQITVTRRQRNTFESSGPCYAHLRNELLSPSKKTICANLISAMTHYWWNSYDHSCKISWISWKKLCLPKALGGLGFKDLELFNQSLLAKQVWRILSNPQSLVARVMKSRYFYDGSLLQAKIGLRPSYAWRSVLFGRSQLSKGIVHQVGNGEAIKLWINPWMLDTEGNYRAPWRKNILFDVNLMVKDILDPIRKSWNRDALNDLFFTTDVEQVLKIKPVVSHQDSWTWKFNKSRDFSVKSAYWLASQDEKNEARKEAALLPSVNPLKEKVWDTLSEPKIKIFLWKSLSNALSVEDGLAERGLKVDGRCQICGSMGESINHVLFSCTFARQVWALSDIPIPKRGFDPNSVFANLNHLLQMDKNKRGLPCIKRSWPWCIWNIWKRRNKFLFEGTPLDALETRNQGREESELWFFARSCDAEEDTRNQRSEGIQSNMWSPPSHNWDKCNIGIFWCKERHLVGAAWVIRDHEGTVLLHSRRAFYQVRNLDEAKLKVLTWSIESLISHQRIRVVFAMEDNLLVNSVNHPSRWPAFRAQSEELRNLLSHFSDSKLICEQKGSNKGADLIASSVSSLHLRQSYVAMGSPDWLTELFEEEAKICSST